MGKKKAYEPVREKYGVSTCLNVGLLYRISPLQLIEAFTKPFKNAGLQYKIPCHRPQGLNSKKQRPGQRGFAQALVDNEQINLSIHRDVQIIAALNEWRRHHILSTTYQPAAPIP